MANEYYAAQVGINCGGQHALCEFHYRIVNPTEPNEFLVANQLVEELADISVAGTWMLNLLACISSECFVSSIRAKRVAPSGGNTFPQAFEPTDLVGGNATTIKALQIASCIIWVPTISGSKTGRNFIPGVPDDALASSRWDASQIAAIDAFVAQHIVGFAIAAGTMLPVVFDRLLGTGDVIADGYLSPKVGTIRQREVPI